MPYFDKQNNRLIYLEKQATPDFWDSHWKLDHFVRTKLLNVRDTPVTTVLKKYIKPEDGMILEGGCGNALQVAALVNNGYQCIGVDYAPRTVRIINEAIPELSVCLGDVRHLNFEDAHFAGYLSLGVIEHFWEGYETIGLEMARVIKPFGYLFLAFPYMSPLRKLKGRLGFYPMWKPSQNPSNFYQFALDHKLVTQSFLKRGFYLLEAIPMLGLRATKDEIKVLKTFLQRSAIIHWLIIIQSQKAQRKHYV